MDTLFNQFVLAKPFLHWAGGKTQILDELYKKVPINKINRYVEPFLGGGAFFFMLRNNTNIKQYYLLDLNKDLILTYKVVKNNVSELIDILSAYNSFYNEAPYLDVEAYYRFIRDRYNKERKDFDYEKFSKAWIRRAADTIFLNKTCFNGLYRVNRNGEFNVPMGTYKKRNIYDVDELLASSKALQKAEIICGDFEQSEKYIKENTLIYLDPPYRPLSSTSNFNNYSYEVFDDNEQKRLANFFKRMDEKGAYLLLSNSDPKNTNPDDNFFEELYAGYTIERIKAKRSINSDPNKRGEINELIIRNF